MPKRCQVCVHPRSAAINSALMDPMLSINKVAKLFIIDKTSLARHKRYHLSAQLAEAHERARELSKVEGDHLYQKLDDLMTRVNAVLDRAEAENKIGIFLASVKEVRELVKLMAHMRGQLPTNTTTVNIVQSDEWLNLLGQVRRILQVRYPDAFAYLIENLSTDGNGHHQIKSIQARIDSPDSQELVVDD